MDNQKMPLQIEFKYNNSSSQEDCASCNQDMTARIGFIAFERGTFDALCDDCSGTGDLPLDFDELAKFFDKWRKSGDRAFDYWRYEDGCFIATERSGRWTPIPPDVVRSLMQEPEAFPAARPARTSRQILDQTNELARKFYALHDRGGSVEKGYRFDLSDHPQEEQVWRMACEAQLFLTETDLRDVLSDLED